MSRNIPRLAGCPNCGFSYFDLKHSGFSSVTVAKYRDCGQVMCANCCESSFWHGYTSAHAAVHARKTISEELRVLLSLRLLWRIWRTVNSSS